MISSTASKTGTHLFIRYGRYLEGSTSNDVTNQPYLPPTMNVEILGIM